MLQFKDIRQNSTIYILDKNDLEIKEGKVVSSSFAKMEYNPQTGRQEMMITFQIEVDGKSSTYGIPEASSTVIVGNLVFSTDKSGLLHDIEIMETNANQFLNSVDGLIERNKSIVEKANAWKSELNPVFKKEQETEKRFNNIESRFSNVEQKVDSMNKMLENFIKKMES